MAEQMIRAVLLGRRLSPERCEAGMTEDIRAEGIRFVLPAVHPAAFETTGAATSVYWMDAQGNGGNESLTWAASEEGAGWQEAVWTFPQSVLAYDGEARCELRVLGADPDANIVKWHSMPLRMDVHRSVEDAQGGQVVVPRYEDLTGVVTMGESDAPGSVEIVRGATSLDFSFVVPSPVSPVISVERHGKIVTVTVVDASGTHSFTLSDGNDGSGTGDMVKATYDTDDDGVVNEAALLDGHPASDFAAASHTHTKSEITDLPNVSVSTSGSGNAVTKVEASGHAVTVTKGTTFVKEMGTATGSGNVVTGASISSGKLVLKKELTALTSHQDISGLQTKAITDAGGYFTTDTVEDALQEIGAALDGLDQALADLL